MNRKQLNVSRAQRIKRLLLPLFLGLIGALNSWAESKLYFIHSDHLGTPQVVTDENQIVVWKAEYSPFGEATVDEDPDNDGTVVNLNLRFPGQYFDEESGLNYNYFRDYDPTTGRYIQADPRGILLDFSDPQRQVALRMGLSAVDRDVGYLNHNYNYVDNNPLMGVDPQGENPWLIKKGIETLIKKGTKEKIACGTLDCNGDGVDDAEQGTREPREPGTPATLPAGCWWIYSAPYWKIECENQCPVF